MDMHKERCLHLARSLSMAPNDDVTTLLAEARQGDPRAHARLAEVVYADLHRLAHAILRGGRSNPTICTTVLVNESWLRLAGGRQMSYESRNHFYHTAARAMRTILVDYARGRAAQKRGGNWQRSPLDDVLHNVEIDRIDLLAIDDALAQLEQLNPRRSQIVELRFFGGLSVEQVAHALELSKSTVESEWRFARIWLHRKLADCD